MPCDRDASRGDALIVRLLHDAEAGGNVGEVVNEFLAEFPASGVWIASELGVEARPLLADIVELIHHPHRKVRFFGLDVILVCATPEDEWAVNSALDLVSDFDPAVRWHALVFLASASEAVLHAAKRAAMRPGTTDSRVRGLDVLTSVASLGATAIIPYLTDNDPV